MPAEASPAPGDDGTAELDPVVAGLFAAMRAAGRPALSAGTPEDARAVTRSSCAPRGPRAGPGPRRGPRRGDARRHHPGAPAGADGPVVGLLVYADGAAGSLVSLDDFDAAARTVAQRSGCAVLMPDYRLAPEHPFPAGLEDVEDTVLWAAARVADLAGADVPVVLAGDSAGGNLVAVVTHALADRVPIAGQVLIYPVVDADTTTPSYQRYSTGMQLTRQDMVWFFGLYVPEELLADPRVSPLLQAPPADLPPTVVIVAQCDVLRDGGEAYARRLADAGVAVTARRMDGLPHGFIRMHNVVPLADAAVSVIAGDVARLCGAATAGRAGS